MKKLLNPEDKASSQNKLISSWKWAGGTIWAASNFGQVFSSEAGAAALESESRFGETAQSVKVPAACV